MANTVLAIDTLDVLARSAVRREILRWFALHPFSEIHVRELDRLLVSDYRNIHRELTILGEAGICLARAKGRRKLFRLNGGYPHMFYLWPLALIGQPPLPGLERAAAKANVKWAFLALPEGQDAHIGLWTADDGEWAGPALSHLRSEDVRIDVHPASDARGDAVDVDDRRTGRGFLDALSDQPRLFIRGSAAEILRHHVLAPADGQARRRRQVRPPRYDPAED